MQEAWVPSLGWEDPLEKEKATQSSILAWRIPWTVACQAPLSMGFSRQEYWSGWPFPSPGDLPGPEIEPRPPALQADSLPAEPQGKHGVLMGARQKLMQGEGTLPMGHPFIVSLRKLKSRLSQ